MKKTYGLFTATTMIIGIVIGSGIFFKSDDILLFTGGSRALGILVFCIGAFSIIFGSLTLTELSVRTEKNGGVVGYFEDFVSRRAAAGFGWFQTFVYIPSLNAVISWVAGLYICLLLGIDASLELEIFIGFAFMTMFHAVNTLSIKFGGYFQNLSTVIKIIPLIGIAIAGFFSGTSNAQIPEGVEVIRRSNPGFAWIAAIVPIAFSFDGWVITASITNEVKNPRRNMPLALTFGPLVVLGVYIFYFLGLSNLLGIEYIMSVGNTAVNKAGEIILGSYGSRVMLVVVIISILGVVNGITLGSLRMPQALGSKGMIPAASKIETINPRLNISLGSCIVSYSVSVLWLFIHYVTQKSGILRGGDVSEIAIVFSYICYTVLYLKVFLMKRKGIINNIFKGVICPIFALTGSAIILIGGIASNPVYVPIFILFCTIVYTSGFLYHDFLLKGR